MKTTLDIIRNILALAFAGLLVGCADVDTTGGDFTSGVSLQHKDTTIEVPQNDPAITNIESWIKSPNPPWRRSFTTYVPKLMLRNSNFNLNFFDGLAVLNFQPDLSKPEWTQVEREYNLADIPSLEVLRARIEEQNKSEMATPRKPSD